MLAISVVLISFYPIDEASRILGTIPRPSSGLKRIGCAKITWIAVLGKYLGDELQRGAAEGDGRMVMQRAEDEHELHRIA